MELDTSKPSSLISRRRGKAPNIVIVSEPTPPVNLNASLISPDAPCQILSHLFLGSEQHVSSAAMLDDLNITAILNVASESVRVRHEERFLYCHQKINDKFEEDIGKYFEESYEFIEKVRESGGKVLVHCTAGKSRSPTITIAYLIKYNRWSLREAYDFVKTKRQISPNLGFLCMLAEFEKITLGTRRRGVSDLCNQSVSDVSILLVEDEESNIDFTTQMLEKLGHRCHVARNGEQAVGKILKYNYDLVLMDITLPIMDGIQAANQIRELEKKGIIETRVVIIALTVEDLPCFSDKGIDALLPKPLDQNELEQTLKNIRRRKSL